MVLGISLLIAFLGGWVGWVIFAKRKKYSSIIAYAGGFLIGILVFSAVGFIELQLTPDPPQSQVASRRAPEAVSPEVSYGPGIGVTYQDVMVNMEKYFPDMKDNRLNTGEARKMGVSRHGAAIIEVVGDFPGEAVRASLSFMATSDSEETNITDIAITTQFIQNIFPDWDRGPKVVMDELLKLPKMKLTDGVQSSSSMTYGNKRLDFSFVKQLGMFTVSVRNITA